MSGMLRFPPRRAESIAEPVAADLRLPGFVVMGSAGQRLPHLAAGPRPSCVQRTTGGVADEIVQIRQVFRAYTRVVRLPSNHAPQAPMAASEPERDQLAASQIAPIVPSLRHVRPRARGRNRLGTISERTKDDARAARRCARAQVVLLGIAFERNYAAIGSSTSAGGAMSRASVAASTWRRRAPGSAAL